MNPKNDSSDKPDNVVFDPIKQRYTASQKPYATNLGAPFITTVDTVAWKNRNICSANQLFSAQYFELKAAYEALMAQFEYNNLVYSAKFNFEPIVGNTYHLYQSISHGAFLSVIGPNECNFDFIGSFKLNADKLWERLDQTQK